MILFVLFLMSFLVASAANGYKLEILPVDDRWIVVGQNMTLTCNLTLCDANHSSKDLSFSFKKRHEAERTIADRGAQYTSDKCTLTLIIPEMRREDAGFYKCHGPDHDKATKIVHVGDVSMGDVKCNISMRGENTPNLSCDWCPERIGNEQNTWTVAFSHGDSKEGPIPFYMNCHKGDLPFLGCGLYNFNITRNNSYSIGDSFNVSHPNLNISLNDFTDLTIANLSVHEQTSESISVTWAAPPVPRLQGCPSALTRYWLSYFQGPSWNESENRMVKMYLGKDIQSYNITDLQPNSTVAVELWASLGDETRGIPWTINTSTLPEVHRIAALDQTTGNLWEEHRGVEATGIILICVVPAAIFGILFVTAFLRRWYKRHNVTVYTPPWEQETADL